MTGNSKDYITVPTGTEAIDIEGAVDSQIPSTMNETNVAQSSKKVVAQYNTNINIEVTPKRSKRKLFKKGVIAVVFLAMAVLSIAHIVEFAQNQSKKRVEVASKRRNVILMVSDGCGPTSMTYARQYQQFLNGGAYRDLLPLDSILVGTSRTRSGSSWVTDSAAGATAFSCGIKTYNGAIAVDLEERPCGTVMEAAKFDGYLTGLVVTARITDATPATFSSHVDFRTQEDNIALQQIGNSTWNRRVADLIFGGGACYFRPQESASSCRTDSLDLFKLAEENYGWNVSQTRKEFDAIDANTAQLPLLGLYSESHLAYEIDRDEASEPALHEMVAKALAIMDRQVEDEDAPGFFLMIEGSRIDMAAHTNDPVGHVYDILEYNRAIQLVIDYVNKNKDSTTMISVSDHETGGFSLARQLTPVYPEYLWKPEAIKRVKYSAELIAHEILKIEDKQERRKFVINTVLHDWLGIDDAQTEEVDALSIMDTNEIDLESTIGLVISLRAELGWATHGHSGTDVNLYSHGRSSQKLAGNHENIDISKFIANELKLDLQKVTDKLNA